MAEQGSRFGIRRAHSDNLEIFRGESGRSLEKRWRSVSEETEQEKGILGEESYVDGRTLLLPRTRFGPTAGRGITNWKSPGHFGIEDNKIDEGSGLSKSSSASLGFSFSIAGPAIAPHHAQEGKIESGNTSMNGRPVHEKASELALQIAQNENEETAVTDSPMPITLKFSDVKYKVIFNDTSCSCFKNPWSNSTTVSVEKEILHGVTGSVAPGEVLAMMGPSGSGKTSLLNLLGGRNRHVASGSIIYNDRPYSKSLKRRIGFVTQDDVLYPHLTVRETLTYAALLRLPKRMTKQQKQQRAKQVICELGLERCQDTIIGGAFVKGVSGGERKRVCIGHEILIDPSLLFLDEPTSGLDSTTALRIAQLLQRLAKTRRRSIVTTIHQPSSRLFHKFDKLILLGEGHPLYSGDASNALDYFSQMHFSPLITMNPADFLLDLASGDLSDISVPDELEQYIHDQASGKLSAKDVVQYLAMAYHKYNAPQAKAMLSASNFTNDKWKPIVYAAHEWSATWWEQFAIICKRGLKERRHEYVSFLRFSQVLSVSLVLGFLWWQTRVDTPQRLEDQTGLLFFVAVFWGFFPVFMSIFTFPQERAMLAKERAVDMYRLSAYMVARNISDLPLDLSLPILFMFIVYFMTHLRMTLAAFLLTVLTIFLTIIASQGLGLAIGALFMDLKKATTIASVTVMTFMLAGGFFVRHVPFFIKWVKYLSFNFYTYRILLKIQYDKNQQYDCSSDRGCRSITTSPFLRGVPLGGGMEEASIMLAMAVIYRLIAYVALRRMNLNV